ncbi:protein tyrosine phosphatase [Bradyrhizobium sp. ISRA443]|uniref:tyrosine phosphatase family protein n=1 Tax=unclassified Bradyrhizobium TaxID=2631580 RepID=UPI0024798876|nr:MULTISPECIES: protein-tyrosine phosphatase family protein [unclassified Bradyrhizobium]WGR95788.1 protein tyrosine phosphatase [Bradyrhizobium sp. ISRA435]WGS00906.1 protein tyrosine phosphatase [Bradyrhizobium sp. ISRA436]WGS07793.1 protein tyrosine phosphatase [Bradyrhizobium sp. ISRA437]WGS14681.1 protein tyrosine phosphatase [Bradyrhizobium sp. ISRA443]
MLHVCSLAALPNTVRTTGASHVLTVMANVDQVQRPPSVLPANHLKVSMDDITEAMDGFVVPNEEHIEKVLSFVRGWDRRAPMVVHCYAGISRSTASAFAAVCALNPHRDEMVIAQLIREASPIAAPNRLIVSLADKALGREGRMLRALDAMGPGSMNVEGRPFRIDVE